MAKSFTAAATYFLQEGRDNLTDSLKIAFEEAVRQKIRKIVIFTGRGEGVRRAINEFLKKEEYSHLKLVAVTFPQGKVFTDAENKPIDVSMAREDVALFRKHAVPIVRAHLPFDPIRSMFSHQGVLGQDLSLIGAALSIFGGSMSLCVQAICMACDAGVVAQGEHVIALTSDTAILARAASTNQMLTDLIVREILCKPALLTIGKKERQIAHAAEPEVLPPAPPKPLNS